jgi:DNA-binding MarR family transcriptional regulator
MPPKPQRAAAERAPSAARPLDSTPAAAPDRVEAVLEAHVRNDRLIHERMRMGIVSALAVIPSLTFNELKALLHTTDGNLCIHARKLEEAAYITCVKSHHGKLSRRSAQTSYRLTAAGRRALEHYLDHMEALIRATRDR